MEIKFIMNKLDSDDKVITLEFNEESTEYIIKTCKNSLNKAVAPGDVKVLFNVDNKYILRDFSKAKRLAIYFISEGYRVIGKDFCPEFTLYTVNSRNVNNKCFLGSIKVQDMRYSSIIRLLQSSSCNILQRLDNVIDDNIIVNYVSNNLDDNYITIANTICNTVADFI